ncbi:SHOCT domain-containing protein [Sphingobium sp. YR768]|uniref:SHOCT domain-containing protein n=1 Tax=Sphingobium sp. YR768 TaxID=1884365 RepID=UPI0008AB9CC5|nr:SHOCT domain-containing protein [Sphingobium sp. YR768]SER90284.1 Short C-terminal domain-containing protein [Sphingobium sp. YR768]
MKPDNIERLTKLEALRAAGVLTDEEFAEEKRKLLSAGSTRWPLILGAGVLGIAALLAIGAWLMPGQWSTSVAPPQATTPQPVLTPSAPVATTPPVAPAERLARAFEAATSHRRPFVQTVEGEAFTITPVRIVDLPFGPALIATREMKDGCHACTGFLSVYYLAEDQGKTVVRAAYPEAVSGWGWGSGPSDWDITNRFTANPAIYASGGYTGQGVTELSATITELRPEGPITPELIGTGYSDAGAISDDNPRKACELEGRIANVVRDKGFDVIVTGSVSRTEHYGKRQGKFVPMNKQDWGLPCGG